MSHNGFLMVSWCLYSISVSPPLPRSCTSSSLCSISIKFDQQVYFKLQNLTHSNSCIRSWDGSIFIHCVAPSNELIFNRIFWFWRHHFSETMHMVSGSIFNLFYLE